MSVSCPACQARLHLLHKLGLTADQLWTVGNRSGEWRGCAAYLAPAGRTVLCVAKPVEATWAAILGVATR